VVVRVLGVDGSWVFGEGPYLSTLLTAPPFFSFSALFFPSFFQVETVLIPHKPAAPASSSGSSSGGHTTICVSSQVKKWKQLTTHTMETKQTGVKRGMVKEGGKNMGLALQVFCFLGVSRENTHSCTHIHHSPCTHTPLSIKVGCARGCTFCRTGQMGLLRCLSAEEILAQVCLSPPLNNTIFNNLQRSTSNY
jgi:adenine C2-methylase RlmN of 23S rRNA A2503 and tRNA A37